MDAFKVWAGRLAHDKMEMDKVNDQDRAKLIELVAELAKRHPEAQGQSHVHTLHFRKLVAETAMDLGIDLLAIKSMSRFKRGKPIIGRGLLDVWNEVLKQRFGSAVGTNAWREDKRRKIVTDMSKDKPVHTPQESK